MDKKIEIINSARELFKEYGYKKVSMDEIAKKANVTKKTIYHYFKDKGELFTYFITEELEKMQESFEEASKDKQDVSEKISSGLRAILHFRKESPLVQSIMKEEELTGVKSDFLFQYDDEIIKYLEDRISNEIGNKTIRNCNVKLMAFIIYKIFYAIFFEYKGDIEEDEVVKEVNSILQSGLVLGGGQNEGK